MPAVTGRALFGVTHAVRFLVNAASYAISFLSLLAMRTPFQEEREAGLPRPLLEERAEDGTPTCDADLSNDLTQPGKSGGMGFAGTG